MVSEIPETERDAHGETCPNRNPSRDRLKAAERVDVPACDAVHTR